MVMPDRAAYLRSVGEELAVQSRRVRDLIGDAHWYSDGHHKEFLLTALLQRHLPSGILATRGFVVGGSQDEDRSKEQDVLILDVSAEAPLFNQGGTAVSAPAAVLGAISVKTKLARKECLEAHEGLESVREVCRQSGARQPWCAAFFYEPSPEVQKNPRLVYDYIAAKLPSPQSRVEGQPYGADTLCTASDLVFKCAWTSVAGGAPYGYRASGFACGGIASGILLALAANAVAEARGTTRPAFADYTGSASVSQLAIEPFRVFT